MSRFDEIPPFYTVLAITACGLILIRIAVVLFDPFRRKIDLPGPRQWPLVGQGFDLPARPRKLLKEYQSRYGDAFKMRLGWYDWVFFNTPQGVREVFDRQAAITSHKVPLPMAHDYVMRDCAVLTMSYTHRWRKMRGYMHQLLTPKAAMAFVPSQEFEIKQLLNDLANEEGKTSTDFYMHIRRMTFSIMMTSTYGQRIPQWDCEEVRDVYGNMRILSLILSPGRFWVDVFPPLAVLPKWLMPSFWMARKCRKFLHANTMRHWYNLKERLQKGTAPDCFARKVMESDYEAQGLDEVTVSWMAHAMPEAGAETTASVLSNLIKHLAAAPEAQQQAHEEVTKILGDARLADLDDEARMPYVRATIKEILRMCPVVTTGLRHMAGADVHYNGIVIPKNTILVANINALHWNDHRFSEPFKFKPERYLGYTHRSASYANSGDADRDHYGFGAGRRICPGIHLAENGLFLAVANLIWAYEFRPPLDEYGKEKRMDIGDEAFLDGAIRVPKPYEVRIIPRNSKRLALVRSMWERAKSEGYMMRGLTVTESGGVAVSEKL